MDTPAPLTHHPYGPSRWPALAACPRFAGKAASADAEYGTRIHGFLAGLLSGWKDGLLLETAEPTLQNAHERGAYRAAQAIVSTLKAASLTRADLLIEHCCAFPCKPSQMPAGLHSLAGIFGTADAAAYDEVTHILYIFDFKTFYDPDRDYTLQLLGYAAALGLTIAERRGKPPFEVRPILLYGEGDHATHRLPPVLWKDALSALVPIASTIAQLEARHPQPIPEKPTAWCSLCEHYATCRAPLAEAQAIDAPEAAEQPHEAATAKPQSGGPVARHTCRAPSLASAPSAATFAELTPPQAAQLLALAERVAKWADAVKSAAKQAAIDGLTIADDEAGLRYALKTRAGRKVIRVLDLWPACAKVGIGKAEYLGAVTLSSTAATELLRAHGLTAKEARELIAANADTTPGSLTLERA
ncbi:MAG: hypothetical protein ACI4QJ_00870 [Candidatus Spyradenecus sp.]